MAANSWQSRPADLDSRIGEFHKIADAARRILQLEGDPHGALFFHFYIDPDPHWPNSGCPILSGLEYASLKGFYLRQRSVSQKGPNHD